MQIGDLVQISFRGKMALGYFDLPTIGVVTSFISSNHVVVKWLCGYQKSRMHLDFIEKVESSDKKCPLKT